MWRIDTRKLFTQLNRIVVATIAIMIVETIVAQVPDIKIDKQTTVQRDLLPAYGYAFTDESELKLNGSVESVGFIEYMLKDTSEASDTILRHTSEIVFNDFGEFTHGWKKNSNGIPPIDSSYCLYTQNPREIRHHVSESNRRRIDTEYVFNVDNQDSLKTVTISRVGKKSSYEVYRYSYNESGVLREIRLERDGELMSVVVYGYGENGELLTKLRFGEMYGPDYGRRLSETHYTYIDNGKHLDSSKETNYRDDYHFAEPVIRYRLYKDDDVISLKTYSVQDSTILHELRFESDSLNHKVYSMNDYYTFSHIGKTEEYVTWNELGCKELIETVETSSKTGMQKTKKKVISYEYDKMNNWTERTITIDGHLRTFGFRKITYFN